MYTDSHILASTLIVTYCDLNFTNHVDPTRPQYVRRVPSILIGILRNTPNVLCFSLIQTVLKWRPPKVRNSLMCLRRSSMTQYLPLKSVNRSENIIT